MVGWRIRQLSGILDEEPAAAAIPNHVLDRFAFAGTPQEVSQQVLALFDAGASRVELGTPHGLSG